MPLPWIRLDTSMPDHPKILELAEHGDPGLAAGFVWVCSMAYAGKHGTDGRIPPGALSRINGRAKHSQLLVATRLWDGAEKGWQIHDYEDYNMLSDAEALMRAAAQNGGAVTASRMTAEERSERARKAADARWGAR